MPGTYLFEFIGHIDERKRPENFPKEIFVRETYRNLADEQVKALFNDRVMTLANAPGLVIILNEDVPLDGTRPNFDQRAFVPWHMITHFHGRLHVVTEQPIQALPLKALVPNDSTGVDPQNNKVSVQ
jgi:hypothetical protein